MQQTLSLESPDTLNLCLLRLVDTSFYLKDVTVLCPLLQVTVPGFTNSVAIPNVVPGFTLNLNACDLLIQTTQCGTVFSDLCDGIYILRWSVSPNDIVYVEYNHLRITHALNLIQKVYCKLSLAACDPPADIKATLKEISLLQGFFAAAKSYVERCGNPERGMTLYNYALKRLKKLTCNYCI